MVVLSWQNHYEPVNEPDDVTMKTRSMAVENIYIFMCVFRGQNQENLNFWKKFVIKLYIFLERNGKRTAKWSLNHGLWANCSISIIRVWLFDSWKLPNEAICIQRDKLESHFTHKVNILNTNKKVEIVTPYNLKEGCRSNLDKFESWFIGEMVDSDWDRSRKTGRSFTPQMSTSHGCPFSRTVGIRQSRCCCRRIGRWRYWAIPRSNGSW